MPAAAWAARSGDPVLFSGDDRVPKETVEAMRHNDGGPCTCSGPSRRSTTRRWTRSRTSRRRGAASATRIRSRTRSPLPATPPAAFGWNINDPGTGPCPPTPSVRRRRRAAPLSASGTWGPLLVTDDAAASRPALPDYLLDVKPGYPDDPTRAVYNHVWVIGDPTAVSVGLQAEVDEMAEVVTVKSGGGEPRCVRARNPRVAPSSPDRTRTRTE